MGSIIVRLTLILVPPFLLAVLVLLFASPRIVGALQPTVEQPVNFPHPQHVQVAQLDCQFCHRMAGTSAEAGVPAVEQCIMCHQVVRQDSPEVKKLVEAMENNESIDWNRVHRMPDHVRFVHEAHVTAGIDCTVCHGPVGEMVQVEQVRPLNMGDCINCHRERGAPFDCTVCHK